MREEISVKTSKRQEIIDITSAVNDTIKRSGVKEGICNIFAMHATASIIVNENHDPNICVDLIEALNNLIPSGIWRHDKMDGNADSHIKSAILGPGETVPVKDGRLYLGRWQSVMLAELDGPRQRAIAVTVIGD
ncbi:YjbQ family protein [Candidatus Woesearchaeota archaeon]|nr:YjbQ family protein [Candidatus Woesearchaeota archaeon]